MAFKGWNNISFNKPLFWGAKLALLPRIFILSIPVLGIPVISNLPINAQQGEIKSIPFVLDSGAYGYQNASILKDPSGRFGDILRVRYPKGSSGDNSAETYGSPEGGYKYRVDLPDLDTIYLSYFVRFSDNFDFNKGGKLPGVCGGNCPTNNAKVDPAKGFSERLMWRREGDGEIYLYIPEANDLDWGLRLGTGSWRFKPGVWYQLEVEIKLNSPDNEDGSIAIWVNGGKSDGSPTFQQNDMYFRSTSNLKVDQFFFTTFHGGSDPSWGPSRDVYADFADIKYGPAGVRKKPSQSSPDPESSADAIRVEAEQMFLSAYRIESQNSAASNGGLISLQEATDTSDTASSTFSGASGKYDVYVGYFDEDDGVASLELSLGGKQIDSWLLDQNLGSPYAVAETLVRRKVASGVSVSNGAKIEIKGKVNNKEWARVDYIEFVPAS